MEGAGASGEKRLFWLTTKLFNLYALRAEPLKAWGAIQTSLDVLTDPGYQQILRCLAADLPFPSGWWLAKGGLRVAALAKLGRPVDAERALRQLFADIGTHATNLLQMCNADPMLRPARDVWSRLDRRTYSRSRMAFMVFFLLCAAVAGWFGLHLWNKARYHATWRPVKGKLVQVKSLESQQHFTYTDDHKAEAKLASLRRLTHVTVYYDPANPQRSALERKAGESTLYAILTWLGALLLLAIAGLILRSHVRRRRLLSGVRT